MRKKVRSKLMSMALVFTMAAGLLSGCGGNNVAEADKNTITIWHDKEDAVAEVLQKKLEELEPDVHVVLEKKSDWTESLKMIGSDPRRHLICISLRMIRLAYMQRWGSLHRLRILFQKKS